MRLQEELTTHLGRTYGVSIRGVAALDTSVLRLDHDESTWVARVFPPARSLEEGRGRHVTLEPGESR